MQPKQQYISVNMNTSTNQGMSRKKRIKRFFTDLAELAVILPLYAFGLLMIFIPFTPKDIERGFGN